MAISPSNRLVLFVAGLFLHASPVIAGGPVLRHFLPAGGARGTTVEVTAAGAFERWPVQAWSSGTGLTFEPTKERGKFVVRVAADASAGPHLVRLDDSEGASALRPFIVGAVPEVLEKEPNDEISKAQALDMAAVIVNGRLQQAGDVDCFALKLRRGQTLVADLAAHEALGSPMDGVLQVVSGDGFVLEQNHDYAGLDPRVVFRAPADATYVVRLFAFPAVPDASIQHAGGPDYVYRLTLTTSGFADHAFPLAVGPDGPETVALVGWSLPEAARCLTVPPADEDGLATLFHPLLAGPVRLRREPHPSVVASDANARHRPQSLSIPVTVSGRLNRPGAAHAYRFPLRKGEQVSFGIESRSLGFLLDAALVLTDDAGKPLARAEAAALNRDPELAFTALAEGTYRLEVRDHQGGGGPRHVYRLRATVARPDFDLKLASDRFVLMAGGSVEVPVTIERRNGFGGQIELTTEGLPAGVRSTAAVLAAGSAGGTVRLTAAPAAAAVSGPIHMLGHVRGKDGVVRRARAAIEGLPQTTTDLWLTLRARPAPAK